MIFNLFMTQTGLAQPVANAGAALQEVARLFKVSMKLATIVYEEVMSTKRTRYDTFAMTP